MELRELMTDAAAVKVYVGDKDDSGPHFTIHYRPSRYTWAFRMSIAGMSFDELTTRLAEDLLESWDLTRDGEPVPLTAENILKLPSAVGTRILDALVDHSLDRKN